MAKQATKIKNVYPTELIAKAQYEMRIFERVGADTGEELIAEVLRLRAQVLGQQTQIDRFEEEEYNRQVQCSA